MAIDDKSTVIWDPFKTYSGLTPLGTTGLAGWLPTGNTQPKPPDADDYFGDGNLGWDPYWPVKCECGSDTVPGLEGHHSDYCPKFKKEL